MTHACKLFAGNGRFYVRCMACNWWAGADSLAKANAKAEGHERQGQLAFGGSEGVTNGHVRLR